jgi:hypothetical protein
MPLTLILGGEYIYYDKNLGMMVAGDNSNSELIEQSDNVPLDGRHKCKEHVFKDKRFVEKKSESLTLLGYKIVVDTVTGVNYLETPKGGITPLLDKNGKICIDKKKSINKKG